MTRRRVRVSRGIYRDQHGLAAIVSVKGRLTEKRFPRGTSLKTIQDWRDDTATALRQLTAPRARRSLAADIAIYLARAGDMPTFAERKAHLKLWEDALGAARARGTITRDELAAVLARWIQQGLAPQTIRHRRNALARLYTVLDGKGAPNPVRDLELPQVPDPEPHAVPYALALKVLDAMPDSKTKIRLRVMLETGLPHKQLGELKPEDIDGATLLLRRRRKGKGRAPLRVPLTPSAVAALKAFAREGCWGPFSNSSMHTSLRRVCDRLVRLDIAKEKGSTDADSLAIPKLTVAERAYLQAMRPYDFRHTFGTEAFRATRNLGTVQLLMGHASSQTTRVYTLAGVADHLSQAVKDLAAHLAADQTRNKPS